ncbi:uncharacterized protein LOC129584127 [Paramacrobiotus metropolitanus]|uniref:uncharacterized protein LOC129584127 n=1 Tax=Paramacrobiotus metropolitanus TaxID=2943436 RepID=UPI002446320E|nr:uncharacterized protein LOC129584127 [Paramacrobiotus metropolitanus]
MSPSAPFLRLNATLLVNSTRMAQPPIWLVYELEQRIWYGIMVASCIVGTISSLFLIAAIFRSQASLSGSSCLMVNLLVKVVLQCGIAIPLVIQSYPDVPFNLSNVPVYCANSLFLYSALMPSIDYADLMIGINRFVAICFPHHYAQWTRRPVIYSMIAFSWATALVFAVAPLFPTIAAFKNLPPWHACGVVYSPFWSLFFSVAGIAFPVILLFILYVAVFVVMLVRTNTWRKQVTTAGMDVNSKVKTIERRFRSTNIFFTVFVCYACCMLPAPLAAPLFPKEYARLPFLRQILRALMTAGTASIPVLYFAMNDRYRKGLLQCGKLHQRSRVSGMETKSNAVHSLSKPVAAMTID